jgi:hypothetical protein
MLIGVYRVAVEKRCGTAMFGMSNYVMRYLSMDFETADECSKSVSHDGSIYRAILDLEELHSMH